MMVEKILFMMEFLVDTLLFNDYLFAINDVCALLWNGETLA